MLTLYHTFRKAFSAFLCAFFVSACQTWVQNIDVGGQVILEERGNEERYIPQFINGVLHEWSRTINRTTLFGSTLSDELFATRSLTDRRSAFFWHTLALIATDKADNPLQDEDLKGVTEFYLFSQWVRLRFTADTLIERARQTPFGAEESSQRLRKKALWTGYFYSAATRYIAATYFGIDARRGGSPIDPLGRFVSSDELYGMALARLDSALIFADVQEKKATHSFMARVYLFRGNFTEAERAANAGLREGDTPIIAQVPTDSYWWFENQAHWLRSVPVAARFRTYREETPEESARLPLRRVQGSDGVLYDVCDKYPQENSPMNFLTWQENELMLAECKIRRGANAEALQHINRVRTAHNLRPLAEATLETIYTERDKELFCTGMRLPDQRRFNRWHLGAGTWQYLPIPKAELDNNPNLKP